MDTYTIVGNTLLLGEDAKTLSEDEIQAIFNHFVQVVSKNQHDISQQNLVRESKNVFRIESPKQKKSVSFGACHVRYIPKENNGLKVSIR
jgi:hypothetical protein